MKLPFYPINNPADKPIRVHMDHPHAVENFSKSIHQMIQECFIVPRPLVILCIGTDRSTGDSLGPLVGTRLQSFMHPLVKVYGTLDQPVHAVNLEETLKEIQSHHENAFTIAIDACLGRTESIGYISLKAGPLQPGTGVNKNLPEVGDAHIVGIVNVGGFMEYLVLQNTRLSVVMRMAQVISDALSLELMRLFAPVANMHASATVETIPFNE